MLALVLLLQTAQPDIQLNARIEARSMKIERHGEARLEVRSDPDGGNVVKADVSPRTKAKEQRNVVVTLDAEARIGTDASGDATGTAQPR
ncbi:hypothetical protein [Sphingomonas xanthus]|uniref:Uncharacterized protein n=1 Tax=Sphingomonas xanthus TaxID=2594473 RepID=A0A516IR53_9SPHN|nr:hypothetical protein [Sphingomonas xanthus]QDP19378.1 hypothetical protein FMM02_05000 [Sphingomonas xanthus]